MCKFFLVFLCIERYCLKSEEKRVSGAPEILALLQRKTRFFGNISQNVFRKTRLYWLNLSSSLAMDVLHQDKSNILLKQVLDYIVTKGHMYHEFFALVYSCIFSTIQKRSARLFMILQVLLLFTRCFSFV